MTAYNERIIYARRMKWGHETRACPRGGPRCWYCALSRGSSECAEKISEGNNVPRKCVNCRQERGGIPTPAEVNSDGPAEKAMALATVPAPTRVKALSTQAPATVSASAAAPVLAPYAAPSSAPASAPAAEPTLAPSSAPASAPASASVATPVAAQPSLQQDKQESNGEIKDLLQMLLRQVEQGQSTHQREAPFRAVCGHVLTTAEKSPLTALIDF
ncbi:eukaryotic translation initiation factor 3 subunit F-like [Penaeus monodon]|uniref:eukaryotic translation initiation factor 3 subunit F-like n=1 Tax=Penaeus monodon TaxID=6687 RepID=UPI0018A78A1C|nr:eukaryotic translation initiation factor 3 subunit F-like [Penaeus monodon]